MDRMDQSMRAHEDLTPEQYEAIKPLLALADVGNLANPLTEHLKPASLRLMELKRRFLNALREQGTITHAAAAAGVARNTVWRWRRDDEEFRVEVDTWLHQDQVDELHDSMYRIATSTDPKIASAAVKAGEFLLKSLDRETYSDHLKIETTQSINVAVSVVHDIRAKHRTEFEQLRERMRALRTIDVLPAPAIEEG